MRSFEFGDVECLPLAALMDFLNLPEHLKDLMIEEAVSFFDEKDYIEETVFVVKQMVPKSMLCYYCGRDDDEMTMLLTKSGVEKMLIVYDRTLIEKLIFKPKLRVVK